MTNWLDELGILFERNWNDGFQMNSTHSASTEIVKSILFFIKHSPTWALTKAIWILRKLNEIGSVGMFVFSSSSSFFAVPSKIILKIVFGSACDINNSKRYHCVDWYAKRNEDHLNKFETKNHSDTIALAAKPQKYGFLCALFGPDWNFERHLCILWSHYCSFNGFSSIWIITDV